MKDDVKQIKTHMTLWTTRTRENVNKSRVETTPSLSFEVFVVYEKHGHTRSQSGPEI